jgi:biopolymer transport protein ExbD
MAIKSRNKINAEFSTASMSDLVFLLLIFFMLTSTLISPNAVKLILPSSNSRTIAKPATVKVYIDEQQSYYVDGVPVVPEGLQNMLAGKLQAGGSNEASVVLNANFNVPVQQIVVVIDAVNNINALDQSRNTKHKVILATTPPK